MLLWSFRLAKAAELMM